MRKALLLFGNEIERENLVDSAVYLQNSLGLKIYPLYIKDMSRDKIVAASTDGMMLGGRSPFIMQGWADVEKEEIEGLERDLKVKGIIEPLEVDIGLVNEIVTEKMKECDTLLIGKNEVITERVVGILKGNYKSIILIGEKPLASLEKVLIANDDGVKINRSCYQFTNLFTEVKKFDSFSINIDLEDNILLTYLKDKEKIVDHRVVKTSNYDEILERIGQYDFFIMGNLSRSYFFEKIIGKNGIKLLEKSKAPIFIG